ncbi:TPA: group II intron reverse transcriptase/maturase [Legionella pneumophila]|nr:group II intron reverse transcriptase/maturase [Legionella pneumophila]HAU3679105.1 group II intron reverse transcriptase/maturase [Legionella pneumophila]HAU4095287.1 group II intron reverse transcriptase/maturase [Legionella pneumophila]
MLAALISGVKGGKWFSLCDKVWRRSTLERAWELVSKNKGACGVDGVTIDKFKGMKDRYLNELSEALKDGSYKPEAVRRVYIPKGDGTQRPLGIPCVKDRIVQAAVKMTLEPIYEKEFLPMSYGFRPGIGAKDALREVDKLLRGGSVWVVDADIQKYFDSIPKDKLMERVQERIADGKILDLVLAFLDQSVMEECKSWTPEKGTPAGAVLSPLLANIYLHDLDVLMTNKGYRMVRYADDFVTLCETEEEANRALSEVKQWMTENGLVLHPDKTRVGNCTIEGEGFEFLGYRFECGKRTVRKSSMKKLRDTIRKRTKRTVGQSMEKVIESLNPTLKGWFGYFRHAHKWTFQLLDGFVRRRLRAILRKQDKRPGIGRCLKDHKQWPNSYFATLGLFTMKEAHAELASRSR